MGDGVTKGKGALDSQASAEVSKSAGNALFGIPGDSPERSGIKGRLVTVYGRAKSRGTDPDLEF
jgi:hypothetical protein